MHVSSTDEVAQQPPIPSDQVTEQLHRLLQSDTFKSSGILRQLLDYLTACSLEGRSESVKVKEIARAVFGRSENFDSQSDSVVRVHTGRLRSKLAEYYIDEGASDELIIAIPKGSYGLSWHPRFPTLPPPPAAPAAPSISPVIASPQAPRTSFWKLGLAALLLVVATAVVTWSFARTNSSLQPPRTPALATFWHPFVSQSEAPLLVFSNFRVVGDLDSSIHAVGGDAGDRGGNEVDTYTTTGEVMGVFEVTRALAAFGQTARAKHGQLLSWDDAKDSNLIFIGGPLAHTPLRNLSAMDDLQFKKGVAGYSPRSAAILNLHPRPGEKSFYLGPETRPYTFDFGVIMLKPMFNRERRTLILAGITEFGTQGVADFVTQEEHVNELLSKLHMKRNGTIPNFEALVRVKIQGDVPVQYELVLVHAAN